MDVEKLLKKMTLFEKATLCMGFDMWHTAAIERLGIPSVTLSDGPHGLRRMADATELSVSKSEKATCFPAAALSSCSFDRALIKRLGAAIADEATEQGVDIVLGPAINIKRSPLCGRNFEYVSEDPYVAAQFAQSWIDGLQERGVGCSLKHFAVNNQETLRMTVDAVVDERALREIYLSAFEYAVKRCSPYSLMSSYNMVNGQQVSDGGYLCQTILRGEWGYDGLVMSDWTAVNDRVRGVAGGCDLEMPYSGQYHTEQIVAAVKDGTLDGELLDCAARRVLRLVNRCITSKKLNHPYSHKEHDELAYEIAANSMVLLKNDGILPLAKGKKLAFIGGFFEKMRIQGGGSSHINPTMTSCALECFKDNGFDLEYSKGFDAMCPKTNRRLLSRAAACARRADIAVVIVGLAESQDFEGIDRQSTELPDACKELAKCVLAANPNTVFLVQSGSAVAMPFSDSARAILYTSVTGQGGARAIADIIFGKVNPSGKLTETFPIKTDDTPCYDSFPGGNKSVYYKESIFVGYRYYDTFKKDVLYPFGYGLSYTSFEYSSLTLTDMLKTDGRLRVSFMLKNTGSCAGKEVAQVYVSHKSDKYICVDKQLRGFEKVHLMPGESKAVEIVLCADAFSHWDKEHGFCIDSGIYTVLVGASSRDTPLEASVKIDGIEVTPQKIPANYREGGGDFTDSQFAELCGHALSPLSVKVSRPFDENTPLCQVRKTAGGKLLYHMLKKAAAAGNPGKDAASSRKCMVQAAGNNPLRSLASMNGGLMTAAAAKHLAALVNGHLLRGARGLLHSMKNDK
ncbi:MAG: glycoside hydrolase family 3 C-terminal domain-containing protein [Oscillospiraceae bacterium]